MRAPVSSSSWLNRTVFLLTALYSFTGTFTSPKLIAPLQIARAMAVYYRIGGPSPTDGTKVAVQASRDYQPPSVVSGSVPLTGAVFMPV